MSDILIVDDERDIRELISDILQDEGYSTRLAGNSDDCMKLVEEQPPALMVLDIWLKDSNMDGIDILKTIKRENPTIPVVIISGHGNIEIAVAAIKQGAYDFIEKPFNIDQLMVVVRRAMEASQLRHENQELKRQDDSVDEMVGSCTAFKTLKSQLDKVTKSNGRVMLTGPAGSGKEIAARYIHSESNRSDAPFISVNSASVEPNRMEEVLFGHENPDGSIEQGLLEQANGGVLFFDEIADMPVGTQSKILRVLVDQKFVRTGGSQEVLVDVRVVSSTNKNLEMEIQNGTFREELYHRLNVVPIVVPSLEERREDVPELANYFIARLNASQGLPLRTLSDDTIALLQTSLWPGNVRQLKNLLERILILGENTGEITPSELPQNADQPADNGRIILSGSLATLPLREARELFEREYLMTQINRFGGNISKTANFVGMERSALHRKLKSLSVVTSSKAGARVAHVSEDELSE